VGKIKLWFDLNRDLTDFEIWFGCKKIQSNSMRLRFDSIWTNLWFDMAVCNLGTKSRISVVTWVFWRYLHLLNGYSVLPVPWSYVPDAAVCLQQQWSDCCCAKRCWNDHNLLAVASVVLWCRETCNVVLWNVCFFSFDKFCVLNKTRFGIWFVILATGISFDLPLWDLRLGFALQDLKFAA